MKKLALFLVVLLFLGISSGCGKKQISLNPEKGQDITVLTMDGNLTSLNDDQQRELDIVMRWMDRDIIQSLNRSGFNATLIKKRNDYNKGMGKLLIIDVAAFNPGSRAARAFVGYGAGAASLDLDYVLLNDNGGELLRWKDGVGSSKGGTYCAQTLNRNAVAKVVHYVNNN
ncbi:MAG: DUF4410 domain-containing protein [Desulfopila sp.]|nr:DUF4410 domain-containing protein [Desulfopila sp.]